MKLNGRNAGLRLELKRNVKRLERAKKLKSQLEKDESSYRIAIKSVKPIIFKPSSDNSRFVAEFLKHQCHTPNSSNKIIRSIN